MTKKVYLRVSVIGEANQLAVATCGPDGSTIKIEQLENDYLSTLGTTEIVFRHDAGDYMSFDFTAEADYMYISSLTDGLLQYCFATDELLPIDATVKGSVRRSVTGDVYVAPVGVEYIIQIVKNSPFDSERIRVQERTLSTGLLAVQPHKVIEAARTRDEILAQRFINHKQYELKDHLGNVNSVVSDLKTAFIGFDGRASDFEVTLNSVSNYYPGGSLMPGRNYSPDSYRFGYQGSEKDDEIAGVSGAHITTKFRQGDTRVVKWWSIDPKANASWSPYSMMNGNPIWLNDYEGDTIKVVGSTDFVYNTNLYIAKLRVTDKGAAMLAVLENAKTIYTIKESVSYQTSAYNGDKSWKFNLNGGFYRSNTMYYDDNPWKSKLGGADIDGFLIFGHEFYHMFSDEMSLRTKSGFSGFSGGEPIENLKAERAAEGGAMVFGNYLRTVYGYKNWKRSNQGKANTNFTMEWKGKGKTYFNGNNERITEIGFETGSTMETGSGLNSQKLNTQYKKRKTERGVTSTVDQDGNEVK
ncbi:MAG: hypothetical protein COW63_08285 [Bacteroidetes bacterium CG18_big_fil_WC_8_21_14_2_50_41_14]|nr:MAG: hypothetical protein COW63_08285 [Bacteroidetes bacterium CG18_big_fil_WC_8_21_14_2_50_41_14]